MDDTTQRKSDAASATRRRRSSILKAARVCRAPLSELEFNAPTPTDSTKGRRVSFSRRNNVAEFVTHEATTTWKNLYEEQNRTLESSVNESAERPRVQQLGSRLVDQQFQEVMTIDFDDGRVPNANSSSSLCQMALGNLDCTSEVNPPLQQQKFELSSLTDHQSKIFGDDLAISGMGELTDKVSFNFSAMQPLGAAKKDDLDQMEDDFLNRSVVRDNVFCQGPAIGNDSECIEIDLNQTRLAPGISNDQSDMSITDTIHSPKVQDVSKTNSMSNDKPGKDWVIDKENIALNPYVAPKETDTFAVNEEPDKVLVFDGKRLTIQSDRDLMTNEKVPEVKVPQRKTIVLNVNDDLPNFVDDVDNSRLPNFVDNESMLSAKNDLTCNKTSLDDSTTKLINQMLDLYEPDVNSKKPPVSVTQTICDISTTQAITNIIGNSEKRKTIMYESDGDISVTKAVQSLILPVSKTAPERRNTIVYDSEAGDISITQALPSQVFTSDRNNVQEKRKTIVFEDAAGDISMTQAVTTNLIMPENVIDKVDSESGMANKRRTIVFDSDTADISMTQPIPTNLIMLENIIDKVDSESGIANKRRTIVFDSDTADISMTQPIPTNLIMPENIIDKVDSESETANKRRTIVFDNDRADISITQAVPANLIMPERNFVDKIDSESDIQTKRRTIVFENETADISMTQAIPANLILPENPTEKLDPDSGTTDKRRTIVFENDTADISITQAVPANLIMPKNNFIKKNDSESDIQKKRRTIVFENDTANISMTQAVPTNLIMTENTVEKVDSQTGNANKRKTILFENDTADISMTQAVPTNLIMPENTFNKVDSELLSESNEQAFKGPEKRQTIVYADEDRDISMTQAVPANLLENAAPPDVGHDDMSAPQTNDRDIISAPLTEEVISVPEENCAAQQPSSEGSLTIKSSTSSDLPIKQDRRKTVFESDARTQAVTSDILAEEIETIIIKKRKTIVFENTDADISMTKSITSNLILSSVEELVLKATESHTQVNKLKTDELENDSMVDEVDKVPENRVKAQEKHANMSITEDSPDNQLLLENFKDNHVERTQDLPSSMLQVSEGPESRIQSTTTYYSITTDSITTKEDNVSMTQESDNELKKMPSDSTESSEVLKKTVQMIDIDAYLSRDHCSKNIFDIRKREKSPTKKGLITNRISPEAQHIIDTLVYQTSTGTNPIPSCTTEQDDLTSSKCTTSQRDSKNTLPETETGEPFTSDQPDDDSEPKMTALKSSTETMTSDSSKNKPLQTFALEDKSSIKSMSSGIDTVTGDNQTMTDDIETKSIALKTSIETLTSDVTMIQEIVKNTLLNDLLDMTDASLDIPGDGYVDKGVTVKMERSSVNDDKSSKRTSSGETFNHMKDADEQVRLDSNESVKPTLEARASCEKGDGYVDKGVTVNFEDNPVSAFGKTTNRPAPGESIRDTNEEDRFEIIDDRSSSKSLESRISDEGYFHIKDIDDESDHGLKTRSESVSITVNKSHLGNRYFEKICSSDLIKDELKNEFELEQVSDDNLKQLKEQISLENEFKIADRRQSVAPRRQSMINREDILNNISMAQSMLQKSQMVDESTIADATNDTTLDKRPSPKPTQIPGDVVKTLRFEEDESLAETNNSQQLQFAASPLKKTALGETSYTRDGKGVIPDYLKDVSDGLKDLMKDLVKPSMALPSRSISPDNIPSCRKTSTRSAHVEANLICPSQISDYISEDVSNIIVKESKSEALVTSESYPSGFKPTIPVDKLTQDKVILFDPRNPLNNVLIAPVDYSTAHKYRPETEELKKTEVTSPIKKEGTAHIKSREIRERELDIVSAIAQYNQSRGDTTKENNEDSICNKPASNVGKVSPQTTMKSTKVNTVIAMKEAKQLLEENSALTLIDSKVSCNDDVHVPTNYPIRKEMNRATLQVMHLSLVSGEALISDNKLLRSETKRPCTAPFRVRKSTSPKKTPNNNSKRRKISNSPPNEKEKGIDKIKEQQKLMYLKSPSTTPKLKSISTCSSPQSPRLKKKKQQSIGEAGQMVTAYHMTYVSDGNDIFSNISTEKHIFTEPLAVNKITTSPRKSPKHNYKPTKMSTFETKEPGKDKKVTSRITNRTDKINESNERKIVITKSPVRNENRESIRSRNSSPRKARKLSPKRKKPESVIVQKQITDGNTAKTPQESNIVNLYSNAVSMCSNSIDASTVTEHCVNETETHATYSIANSRKDSQMDWVSDLTPLNQLSSKNVLTDDSDADVLAKIAALPFMGSRECTWEAGSGGGWAWALLRGRVRLGVLPGDRLGRGASARVEALREESDPIAALCVKFAAYAMHHDAASLRSASAVPGLLRRCLGTARVAIRWAKAMKDTKMRLAYKLEKDGRLSLKVANIPLRSVWEVRMRLEMCSDASCAPYPRATDVRVSSVLGQRVGADAVAKAACGAPMDWGHAVHTIWKVFKYLKHKQPENVI